jgi:hypothetical protein
MRGQPGSLGRHQLYPVGTIQHPAGIIRPALGMTGRPSLGMTGLSPHVLHTTVAIRIAVRLSRKPASYCKSARSIVHPLLAANCRPEIERNGPNPPFFRPEIAAKERTNEPFGSKLTNGKQWNRSAVRHAGDWQHFAGWQTFRNLYGWQDRKILAARYSSPCRSYRRQTVVGCDGGFGPRSHRA